MSSKIENTLLLPYLELVSSNRWNGILKIHCRTVRRPMACLKCASECVSVYDHRNVVIRDEKIRNMHVELKIEKKRYFCKKCKKPRTESVDGVLPGRRTTQRFRAWIKDMCEKFSNLEDVCKEAKCSRDLVYRHFMSSLN